MVRVFAHIGSKLAIGSALAATLIGLISASSFAGGQPLHLIAKFTPGDEFQYRINLMTSSTGKTTTPIANPEGGSKFRQTVSLLVRVDVLPSSVSSQSNPRAESTGQRRSIVKSEMTPVRLRVTYESSHAVSESDAPIASGSSPDKQYDRLKGHSFEFTIAPGGELTDFRGLEGIFLNASGAGPVLSWVKGLSTASEFPRQGIVIGQKWSSDIPLKGLPLSGLAWRETSTYVRNEPCDFSGTTATLRNPPTAHRSECAVILTRFEIHRHGPGSSETTPPSYLRNGLRTSGTWTGSGDSLDLISLTTGLLITSTRTSTQQMDYEITSASTGSQIHRVGKVRVQSEITLVSSSKPTAKP